MHYTPSGGWIELVCGSMFSGKTEELVRRLKRADQGIGEHHTTHSVVSEPCLDELPKRPLDD